MKRVCKTLAVFAVILSVLSGCQAMSGKSTGRVVDDASITASVKTRLVTDSAANLTRVDVDTTNGTVYLNGIVETPEQKARAEQRAWQAGGVKAVVNNLQVQKK